MEIKHAPSRARRVVVVAALLVTALLGGSTGTAHADGWPVVTGIEPATGPPAGGGTVTLHGTGFVPTITFVVWGGQEIWPHDVTPTTVSLTAPAGEPGEVEVLVVVGELPGEPLGYTYVVPTDDGEPDEPGPTPPTSDDAPQGPEVPRDPVETGSPDEPGEPPADDEPDAPETAPTKDERPDPRPETGPGGDEVPDVVPERPVADELASTGSTALRTGLLGLLLSALGVVLVRLGRATAVRS